MGCEGFRANPFTHQGRNTFDQTHKNLRESGSSEMFPKRKSNKPNKESAKLDAKIKEFEDSVNAKLEAMTVPGAKYAVESKPYRFGEVKEKLLMRWVLGDQCRQRECSDCGGLARGGPYKIGACPSWPGTHPAA